jgi:D-glycero-alpha-D-manno-heptose-7-phosphate kinase
MRLTLGGGGTDLRSYYREFGGFVISAAVDKYVYIHINEAFIAKILVKYSKYECVDSPDEVAHPIVREALRMLQVSGPNLEIVSISDVPAGTGLGSSGSFTTALLRGLHALNGEVVRPEELAEEACRIELDLLHEPIGKQDQYIASFGGISCFEFHPDGSVAVSRLRLAPMTQYNLEDGLILFFTKYTRNASEVLRDQDTRSRQGDRAMIENMHVVKRLGYESKAALEAGDLRGFAEIMHVHWENKKRRTAGMSNGSINQYYQHARSNGALGGKLIGAGGGGFLMFYTEDKTRLRRAMHDAGLREVRFRFDFEGCKVLADS